MQSLDSTAPDPRPPWSALVLSPSGTLASQESVGRTASSRRLGTGFAPFAAPRGSRAPAPSPRRPRPCPCRRGNSAGPAARCTLLAEVADRRLRLHDIKDCMPVHSQPPKFDRAAGHLSPAQGVARSAIGRSTLPDLRCLVDRIQRLVPSLGGSDDRIWVSGPDEELGLAVVVGEVAVDGGLEVDQGME